MFLISFLCRLEISFSSESEPAGQTLPEDELDQTKLEGGGDQKGDLTSQEVEVDADIAKKDGMKNYFNVSVRIVSSTERTPPKRLH